MIDEETKLRLVKLPKWVGDTMVHYEHDLALLRSLTNLDMTMPPHLDIPDTAYKHPVQGYEMNRAAMEVWYSWSKPNSHGRGKYNDKAGFESASPGKAHLYATETAAWQAIRAMTVKKFAEELMKIDNKLITIKAKELGIIDG